MLSMRNRLGPASCLWLLVLAASGCQRGADGAVSASGADGGSSVVVAVPAQDSERTWAGLLPCADCAGVDTRLVLRTERGRRDYVMTETYIGGSGQTSFNRSGVWTERRDELQGEAQVVYVLDPDKAPQRLVLQPDGALELRESGQRPPEQALAYRLQRL